jgi:ABC-2 type transport system permease protein
MAGGILARARASIARRARMMRAVATVTYKEWAAYRSHMLLSVVVGPLGFLAQLFIWTSLFAGKAELGGFSLAGMLRYYGAAAAIYYLTMDFADWNLQMLVRSGKFLAYCLRPMEHRFFALSQKVGHRLLGAIFEFLPVWLIFALAFGIVLVPASAAWAILSILLAFLMMFLVNYTVGALSFWLVRTDGLRSLFRFARDLLAGSFIPLTFFPEAAQKVLFFLPFQFATYLPIRVFLGSYSLGGITLSIPQAVAAQALAVAIMWLLSGIVFRLGLKRYTGVGA